MTADLVSLLDTQVLGNSVYTYAFALGLFLATFFGLHVLLFVLNNRLKALVKKNESPRERRAAAGAAKDLSHRICGPGPVYRAANPHPQPAAQQVISIGCITLITYMAIDASSVLLTLFLRRMANNENHQTPRPS